MVKKNSDLYEQMVAITSEYLGPAAERFLYRQVKNHLGISPDQLKQSDLKDLLDWIRLAMTVLTNDDKVVEEYMRHLNKLMRNERSLPHEA